MAQLLIETEGVVKDYILGTRKVHALRGVSVTIHAGEFVAVMGPSGSGKSTFMNLLGCLDTPTSGRYLFDGVDVSHLGADKLARVRNEKIGFVFQTFNLLARTTALENVELPLLYSHLPPRERRPKAADEPTGALDSRTSVEIMGLFQDLNREGITVVLVTHEPDVARYAGRTLSFRDGRLIRDDAVPNPTDARRLLASLPSADEDEDEA
ncbi:MAG: macrolide ABC transporter ATP-binding protein [Candidatus Rokuibacteriota bacterium]|nr:MAG: macrolide ABC transporter ATP-binding protein [Candidatus Rokubacteria bacterium]